MSRLNTVTFRGGPAHGKGVGPLADNIRYVEVPVQEKDGSLSKAVYIVERVNGEVICAKHVPAMRRAAPPPEGR